MDAETLKRVEVPEGFCETCEGTLRPLGGGTITFIETPVGLICDNCVEDMYRELRRL